LLPNLDLRPYSKNIKNSLKKEPKCYLYDWSAIQDEGRRLENMVAMHLLKNVHAWTDLAYGEFELFYIRDKQKREVDFLITKNQSPYLLLEVKSGNSNLSPSLIHFTEVLKPTFSIQLVLDKKLEKKPSLLHPNISIMGIEKFLGSIN
jgi:predicted AAA+ superfamily ATPase